MTGTQFGKACTSKFTYNGDGVRTKRAGSYLNWKYVWDVAAGLPVILKETDSHQEVSAQGTDNTYVYGLDLISVTDRTGAQTYFLSDGLGSTANLTNGAGTDDGLVQLRCLRRMRSETGAAANEFRFKGEQRDPQISRQFYYLRARYYDPGTGRFLSRDPIPSGNPYAYVISNPVNYVDPYGMFGIPGTGIDIDVPLPLGPISDCISSPIGCARGLATSDVGTALACATMVASPVCTISALLNPHTRSIVLNGVQVVDLIPVPGPGGIIIDLMAAAANQYQILTNNCLTTAEKWAQTGNNALNLGVGLVGDVVPVADPFVTPFEIGSYLASTADQNRCLLADALAASAHAASPNIPGKE